MAEAQLDSQGRRRQLHRNLDDEFVRVDGHDIYKTPSANLAVAANDLAWLPQTPEVTKVMPCLKWCTTGQRDPPGSETFLLDELNSPIHHAKI